MVAKTVKQGDVTLVTTAWKPLVSSFDSANPTMPMPTRRHVRIQLKSNPGGAMAIAYVQKNLDGTFTTPTLSVKLATVMPGNTTWVEPLGEVIQAYGRLVQKKGFTSNSIRAIITEFA